MSTSAIGRIFPNEEAPPAKFIGELTPISSRKFYVTVSSETLHEPAGDKRIRAAQRRLVGAHGLRRGYGETATPDVADIMASEQRPFDIRRAARLG